MWRQPVLYVPALLTLTLFAVEMTVLGGMRLVHAGGYPDPFAPYEAIMPGQPVAALEQYPCQFQRNYEMATEETICRIRPDEGVFREVVALLYNNKIWQVVFKSDALRVGDMVQRWGYPDSSDNKRVFLFLQGETDAVIALYNPTKRFSFLLPVYALVLTDHEY